MFGKDKKELIKMKIDVKNAGSIFSRAIKLLNEIILIKCVFGVKEDKKW